MRTIQNYSQPNFFSILMYDSISIEKNFYKLDFTKRKKALSQLL